MIMLSFFCRTTTQSLNESNVVDVTQNNTGKCVTTFPPPCEDELCYGIIIRHAEVSLAIVKLHDRLEVEGMAYPKGLTISQRLASISAVVLE